MKTEEIIKVIENRIDELKAADIKLCEDRFNVSLPTFQRQLAREMSNQVTASRHELENLLRIINPSHP